VAQTFDGRPPAEGEILGIVKECFLVVFGVLMMPTMLARMDDEVDREDLRQQDAFPV
jgi:hypothetical protein